MISKIIAQEKINKVEHLIDKYDNIVIVTHTSPDGDAIGSSLGLYHVLLALEKEVKVVVNNRIPTYLKWLLGYKEVIIYQDYPEYAAESIAAAELIFCLDLNTTKRMSEGVEKLVLKSRAKRVLIDHHPDPENFTDVEISYPEISSTSEMVFRLICRLGHFEMIDINIAEAIYTGMMTDTGNFTYNSNNAEIYSIISELLNIGINKDLIFSRVNGSHKADRMRLFGYALASKMKIYEGYHAALIALTKEEMAQFNYEPGDTEGFVNQPLNIEGIKFSCFFREENNRVKISLRSKGGFDVNVVCRKYFNGGGHKNASGGELFCSVEEAINLFESILPEYENELEKA